MTIPLLYGFILYFLLYFDFILISLIDKAAVSGIHENINNKVTELLRENGFTISFFTSKFWYMNLNFRAINKY